MTSERDPAMRALVAHALALPPSDLAARRLWHDTIACAASGHRTRELQALWASHAALSPGALRLPGRSGSAVGAPSGAWLGAVAACWDEACEGLALAHGRPGVPIVAALWARAAHRPLRWGDALRATTVGYQVGGSMGAWLRILPGMHVDACWPSLGVAAAIGVALEAPIDAIVDAIETCASQLAASLYLPIAQGSDARNTYLGHSAWLGLACALSAQAGIAGPRGAAREYAERVLRRVPAGEAPHHAHALVEQAYWKPYACVRHVQYGARAAERLRPQILAAHDAATAIGAQALGAVAAIRLRTYPEAITYCGNRAPTSPIAAQFSLSWGVAAMLRHGALDPPQCRAQALEDPLTRLLESRVALLADPQAFPGEVRGAVLEIDTPAGTLREQVDAIEGDAGRAPSDAQRAAKFAAYCDGDPEWLRVGTQVLQAPPDADAADVLGTSARGDASRR